MLVEVKGISLKADFSMETFIDIVDYKKRYEPHDKISLTRYLQQVTDDNYAMDTVIDLLYYPYAMRVRKQGLLPDINYKDVALHIASNLNLVEEIIADLVASLPDVKEEPKKKPSKTTKAKA
jgi:hypothetical protein